MNSASAETEKKEPVVYSVPSWRMDYLKKRMGDLARRARKLGCSEPQIVELGFEDVPVTRIDPIDGLAIPTGEVERYFKVQVTGSAPSYAGWTFVASVDQMPEVGNLVRVVPGQTLPERYRTEAPHCDQCRAARNRINHYVVRNEQGDYRMVGSSCIKDFLGHQTPENIAAMATLWSSLDGVLSEASDRSGSTGPEFLDLGLYLSYVAAAIQAYGWLSAGRAREEDRVGQATKSVALSGMFHKTKECREGCLHPTDADRDLAARSIAWAQTIEVKSDFDHNLLTLAQSEVLPYRGAGIAAAMVFCYKREIERQVLREKSRAQWAKSVHVGEIGKRQDFTVTVANEHRVDGDWGVTSIYKMADADGNMLTWFASPSAATLEIGKTYVLKGTVKAHEDYKGTKQTVITRCKVLKEIEAETPKTEGGDQ